MSDQRAKSSAESEQRYFCDVCDGETRNRKGLFVYEPSLADAVRGAERINVCNNCIPDDMEIDYDA